MKVLPPGTILQLKYLEERLKRVPPGRFIEIGPGAGDITNVLLSNGWTGKCLDLNDQTIKQHKARFHTQISSGKLEISNGDFLQLNVESLNVDLVISCMVMEHLNAEDEVLFLEKAGQILTADGLMIGLVPASPDHWGIEDDIAGHFRRYSRPSLTTTLEHLNWKVEHLAGLTYPISNLLLPISNFLVARKESQKVNLSMQERTKQSGNRDVYMKTRFPFVAKIFLNDFIMTPLHIIQKRLSNSDSALVLYFEGRPRTNK